MIRIYMMINACALGIFVVTPAPAATEQDKMLRNSQVTYVVNYPNGGRERVVVKYEAFLGAHVWQTGSAWKPMHPYDDRVCHYDTKARVYRRAYLVSVSGVEAPLDGYQAVYEASRGGRATVINVWRGITGQHTTCGSVHYFSGKISAAEAALVSQFDDLVAKDDDKARLRLKAMLMAADLSPVP